MRDHSKLKMPKPKPTAWAWLFTAVLLAGCSVRSLDIETTSRPAATGPVTTIERRETDCRAVDEMDFLDCMVRKPECSVADAVRAVTILVAGGDVAQTHDQRYDYLLERGILRPEWKLDADRWIDRGTLAYMLYQAAGMKGGINMILFAKHGLGDRRYAYRELRYRGLMRDGVDYNYVSGPELVTTVGNVDRYIQEREQNSPAAATALGENPQGPSP